MDFDKDTTPAQFEHPWIQEASRGDLWLGSLILFQEVLGEMARSARENGENADEQLQRGIAADRVRNAIADRNKYLDGLHVPPASATVIGWELEQLQLLQKQ